MTSWCYIASLFFYFIGVVNSYTFDGDVYKISVVTEIVKVMRGRGGMSRGRGGGPLKSRPPFIPHVPFDIVLAEPAFPPVRSAQSGFEEAFHGALLKRNGDLTPSEKEQNAISNLVTKIQTVLDTLIVSPGNFDACVSNIRGRI